MVHRIKKASKPSSATPARERRLVLAVLPKERISANPPRINATFLVCTVMATNSRTEYQTGNHRPSTPAAASCPEANPDC